MTFMRTKYVIALKRKAAEIAASERIYRHLEVLKGIARGEDAVEEGRVVSQAEARERMARWLK
jgi:hypothetical protein